MTGAPAATGAAPGVPAPAGTAPTVPATPPDPNAVAAAERAEEEVKQPLAFTGGQHAHQIFVTEEGADADIKIASTPLTYPQVLANVQRVTRLLDVSVQAAITSLMTQGLPLYRTLKRNAGAIVVRDPAMPDPRTITGVPAVRTEITQLASNVAAIFDLVRLSGIALERVGFMPQGEAMNGVFVAAGRGLNKLLTEEEVEAFLDAQGTAADPFRPGQTGIRGMGAAMGQAPTLERGDRRQVETGAGQVTEQADRRTGGVVTLSPSGRAETYRAHVAAFAGRVPDRMLASALLIHRRTGTMPADLIPADMHGQYNTFYELIFIREAAAEVSRSSPANQRGGGPSFTASYTPAMALDLVLGGMTFAAAFADPRLERPPAGAPATNEQRGGGLVPETMTATPGERREDGPPGFPRPDGASNAQAATSRERQEPGQPPVRQRRPHVVEFLRRRIELAERWLAQQIGQPITTVVFETREDAVSYVQARLRAYDPPAPDPTPPPG